MSVVKIVSEKGKEFSIQKDYVAEINPKSCINCGTCREMCPVGAISENQRTICRICPECTERDALTIDEMYSFATERSCTTACPLGISPQGYVNLTRWGKTDEAYELIWDKMIGGAFVLAKKRPLPQHEDILIFYKNAPIYNPQMTNANPKNIRPVNKGTNQSEAIPVAGGVAKSEKGYNPKKRYPTSILKYSSKMAECNPLHRVHPTQKPVALFEYLIKTYTNEGETVLDNCMGSGTTAIACLNTNRKYIGFEWCPDEPHDTYFKLANERIKEHLT
mgnify:CR=1 FL=1